ncbi:MAG: phage portal protein [Pseudomonadota bacterium]
MGIFSRLFGPRESAAERAAWLDNAVRGAAAQVQGQYLAELRSARRSFEAAETPAWTESWPTHAAAINEDLARQLPTLRARSRGMARNNEWAIGYLIQLDDNVLGEAGIRLQMRLTRRDGTPDDDTNDRLEAAWAAWGQDCDVAGMSWREVESLALASLAQDGELLYRLRPGAGPFGFQIQLLDPALLDVSLRRDWGGNRVRMGVEITDDGRPVAYWLRMARVGDGPSDLITVGRHVRVPAEQIRHRFSRREVGQLRGYPWLSGGARRLWLLKDFEEAAAVASSNAAKRQGFFVSPTGEAPKGFADTIVSSVLESAKAAGKVLTPDEIQALTAAAEKYATTVPGQFDTLPDGYDFRPFESKWPDISAEGYVKQQLRGWAAARGASYVSLGNDLESVNYSSARVGIIGEREHYKTVQGLLKSWLHAEVFAAALPYLVLATPALKMERLAAYAASATWQPRRWAGIDPVKEAQAAEINLRLKLTSRRRLILERGEDPDEIAAEIEAEESRFGALDPENMPRPKAEDDEESAAKKSRARAPLAAVRGFPER